MDGISEITEISQNRASHILNGSGVKKQKKRKPGRAPRYDTAFAAVLEKVWAYMDFACGRRFMAGMADMLTALKKCGEFEATEEILLKLKTVSAATADRLLAKAKKGLIIKGKSTIKPGTLLKKDIPIRMGDEWDDAVPGFVEIDLVAHCGESTTYRAGAKTNTGYIVIINKFNAAGK